MSTKLENKQKELLKAYSFSNLYKNYFEIGTNSKKFPLKRITTLLIVWLFFFITSGIFNLPKLENESLYIFAAQVTIIALIFPIILTLIGILFSKKNDFDSIFKIYLSTTNAKTLYRGSFIILLFYVISFFYLYDSSTSEQIRKALNATLAIAFIDAIIVTLFFLEKTISFTTIEGTNKTFLQYFINTKIDYSIEILSIISNRINENIQNNDLNAYDKSLEFFLNFIDVVIINLTQDENGVISSDLHKNLDNDLFSTKFSKIISLIKKNIENTTQNSDQQYYRSIKGIYFYIFSRNKDYLESKTVDLLLNAHRHQSHHITTERTNKKPQLVSEFISSWYNWIQLYGVNNEILAFNIYIKHIELTLSIIDQFSKENSEYNLDYICDCLCRWESVAKYMPSFIPYQYKLKTYPNNTNSYTIANYILDSKLIALHILEKNLLKKDLLKKYYDTLLNGKIIFNLSDFMGNSYKLNSLEEILFSFLRLFTNYNYEKIFNNYLEDFDRNFIISGLIHGGLIPNLENRIYNLIIKLLLINSQKNSFNNYNWREALSHLNISQTSNTLTTINNLSKKLDEFNDVSSIKWDVKKFIFAKNRLIKYLSVVINITNILLTEKYKNIKLDKGKIKTLEIENSLSIELLNSVKSKSIFLSIFPQCIFAKNVKINYINTVYYESIIFTKDCNTAIHYQPTDNIYAEIIDTLIFGQFYKIRDKKSISSIDNLDKVTKLLLESHKLIKSYILFNDNILYDYIISNASNREELPFYISHKEFNIFEFGNSIFIFNHHISCNTYYIIPYDTIENVIFEKITTDVLSLIEVNLDPDDYSKISMKISLPLEVKLKSEAQIVEVIFS